MRILLLAILATMPAMQPVDATLRISVTDLTGAVIVGAVVQVVDAHQPNELPRVVATVMTGARGDASL